jgi:exosortase H (IPTLxxWG-CTERM-specific)
VSSSHRRRRKRNAGVSGPKAAPDSREGTDHDTRDGPRGADTSAEDTGSRARKHPLLRATIIFVVIVGLFYVAYSWPSLRQRIFAPNLRMHAAAAAWFLNLLGYDVHATDQTIRSDQFSVSVYRGCDAAEPTALFVAAVIAFPASLRRRLLGIVLGVAAVQLLNLVRIVSLFCIGVHSPSVFELMHIHVWQAAFILVAVLLWAIWAWWASAPAKQSVDGQV